MHDSWSNQISHNKGRTVPGALKLTGIQNNKMYVVVRKMRWLNYFQAGRKNACSKNTSQHVTCHRMKRHYQAIFAERNQWQNNNNIGYEGSIVRCLLLSVYLVPDIPGAFCCLFVSIKTHESLLKAQFSASEHTFISFWSRKYTHTRHDQWFA